MVASQDIHSFSNVGDFVAKKFDYLIIGGGTAGLALSARLAEDSTVTVGVIEAGTTHLDDPVIDRFGVPPAGNPAYDWMFMSTPQAHVGDRSMFLARGKMLGGTSGINHMAWSRASSGEYDVLEAFSGTTGWNWLGLLPYMKKSETVASEPANTYPGISPQQAKLAQHVSAQHNGVSGPVKVANNPHHFPVVGTLVETLNTLEVPTNATPASGDPNGVTNCLLAFDRQKGTRSYSASTYFRSRAQHSNHHVLLNANATRILFSETAEGLIATAVEFQVDGKTYTVQAVREVILAAGTVKTPQLLELSGIGNKSILEAQGIPVLLNLPGVGENLQDHLYVGIQFQLKPGFETYDILRNDPAYLAEQTAEYEKTRTGILTSSDTTAVWLPLQSLGDASKTDTALQLLEKHDPLSKIQETEKDLLKEWIKHGKVPLVELIQFTRGFVAPAEGVNYIVLAAGIMHPMSRGSIHITSPDPLAPPAIDPNFLSHDYDVAILRDAVKFIQKLVQAKPLADAIACPSFPAALPETDEEIVSFIRTNPLTLNGGHLLGTAAMAPRAAGGVVDGALKVYGTTNLRVVDASVLPVELACHIQATVYAIAEKAADMIKEQYAAKI